MNKLKSRIPGIQTTQNLSELGEESHKSLFNKKKNINEANLPLSLRDPSCFEKNKVMPGILKISIED